MKGMLRELAGLMILQMVMAAAPPVLVIAVDAFRYDFAEREHGAQILELKKEGASLEALIP